MTDKAKLPLDTWSALGAAVASGLFYFLAFAGVDIWPLAFVAFVPLFVALEGQSPKRALWLGVVTGGTMNLAGFYYSYKNQQFIPAAEETSRTTAPACSKVFRAIARESESSSTTRMRMPSSLELSRRAGDAGREAATPPSASGSVTMNSLP